MKAHTKLEEKEIYLLELDLSRQSDSLLLDTVARHKACNGVWIWAKDNCAVKPVGPLLRALSFGKISMRQQRIFDFLSIFQDFDYSHIFRVHSFYWEGYITLQSGYWTMCPLHRVSMHGVYAS